MLWLLSQAPHAVVCSVTVSPYPHPSPTPCLQGEMYGYHYQTTLSTPVGAVRCTPASYHLLVKCSPGTLYMSLYDRICPPLLLGLLPR